MFDFQSPSFFTRSPCSTILYVCVCLHCWVTQKGKPFRISIIKICIWGCAYPPTLETCCKYNHIIISAKSWSNSNNSFFNNVQQNLSSFQDYYVWFSCFPNTSGWFWCHEKTHGRFPSNLWNNNFPGVEEIPGSRSNLRSAHGIFPICVYFTPQKMLDPEALGCYKCQFRFRGIYIHKSTLAIPASNILEMLVIVCPESKEMNHQDEARQQQVLDVSGFPHVKDNGVS